MEVMGSYLETSCQCQHSVSISTAFQTNLATHDKSERVVFLHVCVSCLCLIKELISVTVNWFFLFSKSMMVEELLKKEKQLKLDSSRFKLLMSCS